MCMSLAPFSIIALRSWWRLTLRSAPCVMSGAPEARPRAWTAGNAKSVRHGHAADFFRRRDPCEHLDDAAHPKRAHPPLDRRGLELRGRCALEHQVLEQVI